MSKRTRYYSAVWFGVRTDIAANAALPHGERLRLSAQGGAHVIHHTGAVTREVAADSIISIARNDRPPIRTQSREAHPYVPHEVAFFLARRTPLHLR